MCENNEITYTPQQQEALDKISTFLKSSNRVFILRGYAGTGKTTLVLPILEKVGELKLHPQLMAPTGRAARVLRVKTGEPATTIHKGIYRLNAIQADEGSEDDETELIYYFPVKDIEFPGSSVLIIDEASMISSLKNVGEIFRFGSDILIKDLLAYARDSKIIFIGDPAQLPPVGDNKSVALDDDYFKELGFPVESFELTEVIRQKKDSAILENATQIRDVLKIDRNKRTELVFRRKEGEVEDIDPEHIIESFTTGYPTPSVDSAVVVCFENAKAYGYNCGIRRVYFPENNGAPVPGDIMMVVSNNYRYSQKEILNGEFATVVKVSNLVETQGAKIRLGKGNKKEEKTVSLTFRDVTLKFSDGQEVECKIVDSLLNSREPNLKSSEILALWVNFWMRHPELDKLKRKKIKTKEEMELIAKALNSDQYFNALHVKYGYAVTCHKAQGGEWDTVFVDYSSRCGLHNDGLRWCYTATTRARNRLYGVSMPNITFIDKLKVNDTIIRAGKAPAGYLSLDESLEDGFHTMDSPASVRAKCLQIQANLEGTPYSIDSIGSENWKEIYNIRIPSGEVLKFVSWYNASGLFRPFSCIDSISQPKVKAAADEITKILNSSANFTSKYSYQPSSESLGKLYSLVSGICNELGITITNVIEDIAHYKVRYCLKTSGQFSFLDFIINKNHLPTYANANSDLGKDDVLLKELIFKFKQ